jgi:hypothetical protein
LLSKVTEGDLTGQLVLGKVTRRRREKHLPAVPGGHDAGCSVHAQSHVALAADRRLARIESHPHANGKAVRPREPDESSLRRDRGGDRISGPAESEEERVALSVDLPAFPFGDCRAQQSLVLREHVVVAAAPEGLEQSRRALDVGEEKGDRPGR